MKKMYTLPELENMLTCRGEEENRLYSEAKRVKNENIGNNVYLRGLIEISNICTKDCYYCGIRKSNTETARYTLSDNEIIEAAALPTRIISVPSCYRVENVPIKNSWIESPVCYEKSKKTVTTS